MAKDGGTDGITAARFLRGESPVAELRIVAGNEPDTTWLDGNSKSKFKSKRKIK